MNELVGLPGGSLGRAVDLAGTAARSLSLLFGRRVVVDPAGVEAHLTLPWRVGEASAARSTPFPAEGGGFVHLDLTPQDDELFGRLLELRPGVDAEELAVEAQSWRLPVTPYRVRSTSAHVPIWQSPPDRTSGVTPLARPLRVLDLTTMWAGPLATHLLASVGAEVTTVEPACRRDGLRRSPRHFAELAVGKRRIDLDLRRGGDRARFEELVDRSDLLVESFSRRVMPNFGYSPEVLRRRNPRLVVVGIRAFGEACPERDWVAYGPGVHATFGHSADSLARPMPAGLAYADALTGLAAAATAASVAGRAHEIPPLIEVALADHVVGLGSIVGGRRSNLRERESVMAPLRLEGEG